MIRKGEKKCHLYKGDYNPTRLYHGRRIADYDTQSASGLSVSVDSEYKPIERMEVTGETTQETKDVRVMSVEGYANVVDGHILGAGEYKSNSSNIGIYDTSIFHKDNDYTLSVIKNTTVETYPRLSIGKINHKYLVNINNETSAVVVYYFDTNGYTNPVSIGAFTNKNVLITSVTSINYAVLRTGAKVGEKLIFQHHDLTDLGLDHLTLDELKIQRPDLFVYQDYHETETRTGFIQSDGSTYPLSAPLYGIGDVKDSSGTNGVEERNFGVVDLGTLNWDFNTTSNYFFTTLEKEPKYDSNGYILNYLTSNGYTSGTVSQDNHIQYYNGYLRIRTDGSATNNPKGYLVYELATPTITHSPSLITDATIVNESYTETTESSPSPNFPSPVIATEELTFGNETMELDLQEGDKVIVSHKVGKNLLSDDVYDKSKWSTIGGNITRGQYLLNLPNGIYTISGYRNPPNRSSFFYLQSSTDNFVNVISVFLVTNTGISTDNYTFEVTDNKKWRLWYYDFSSSFEEFMTFNKGKIQIEQGSIATSYEPYLKDNVWKYNQMKSVDLKSETKSIYNYSNNHGIYFQNVLDATCNRCEDSYCTHESKVGEYYDENDHYMWVGVNDRNIFWVGILDELGIYSSSKTDGQMLSEFDEWLQANSPIVYYKSNAPEWQDLTDSELGQSLLNAKLNPNHITEISVNQGNVEVKYYKEK